MEPLWEHLNSQFAGSGINGGYDAAATVKKVAAFQPGPDPGASPVGTGPPVGGDEHTDRPAAGLPGLNDQDVRRGWPRCWKTWRTTSAILVRQPTCSGR